MTEISKHEEGMLSWGEIGTTDLDAARRFYTELFGWTVREENDATGNPYLLFCKEGKEVVGGRMLGDMEKEMSVPPNWSSFFAVANVDQSTKQATASGGTVFMEPLDAGDDGRLSVIADPNGAVFCLWEPKASIGALLMNEPNTLTWTECSAADVTKAKDFYRELLGWDYDDTDMGDGFTYSVGKVGDSPAAGIYPPPPGTEGIPSHWTPYVWVEDCDAMVERATSLGGQVQMEPMSAEGVGRFAIVADPQGASFGVMKPDLPG